ncbi:MAG: DUF6033 family protein [Lachnospiraceae bacterium]|nr:DUF6033 family protein [Lachnospiraceae bacterium]
MTGLSGISAYQQSNQINKGSERTYESASSKIASSSSSKESQASKVETKGFTPIDTKSSLVPKTSEYGNTIGDVKLSDKAKDYYNQLKGKFHNMEFIAVSKDMKAQVQANAAAYGNANKMVVLIDEEKLERMATDESFRKKYEGIIAMSQTKMAEAKNSLTSSGASVKNFGMSVDSNGKESFFATVEKSQDLQKKRIEKKAAEKKEQKAKEKKKTEKEAREERLQKAKDKKTEKTDDEEEPQDIDDGKEYVTIEAKSMDELLSKVQKYSYSEALNRVFTDSERRVGGYVDFRG